MNLTFVMSFDRFVGKLFNHVLEDPESKSTLVHSLSVCISLLDLKRSATIAATGASGRQHVTEPMPTANPDTVEGMLHRLGIYLSSCLPSTVYTVEGSLWTSPSLSFFSFFSLQHVCT